MTDEQKAVRWEKGADGIAIVTLDEPGRSANTMNDRYTQAMGEVVEALVTAKDELTGVIITSGKKTFFAGGDLELLSSAGPKDAAAVFARGTVVKAQLRTLETLGRPVVAAMNGTALGGGLEIGLACHHRIALDAPGVAYGLPEVTLGLLPGAGGVTRITRMLGIANGFMNVLAQGQRHKPAKALEIGIVDELAASQDEMLHKARAWIAANPDAAQPWDRPGYRIPGGAPSRSIRSSSSMLSAFMKPRPSSPQIFISTGWMRIQPSGVTETVASISNGMSITLCSTPAWRRPFASGRTVRSLIGAPS